MTVYLQENLEPPQISVIEKMLKEMNMFSDLRLISKDEAKAEFDRDLGEILPKMLKDEAFGNPFPASLHLGLKAEILRLRDGRGLASAAEKISTFPGVEDVSYGQDWVQNYSSFVKAITHLGWALAVVLLFAGIFVIRSGLTGSMASRREEIEILELVGATPAMVRKPYVVEGAVLGFLAGLISLGVSAILFKLGCDTLYGQISFFSLSSQIRFLSFPWMTACLVAATVFATFSSYITVRRFNNGWLARGKA